MTADVQGLLSELRRQLEVVYGSRLKRMVLFGSQARGDGEENSDIDVLVVLDGPVRPAQEIAQCSPITAALSLRNDVVISCAFVAEDRYESEQSPFLMNVRREGVPL